MRLTNLSNLDQTLLQTAGYYGIRQVIGTEDDFYESIRRLRGAGLLKRINEDGAACYIATEAGHRAMEREDVE